MKYDVVFEGGGAKGMAFVGACAELLARGHSFGRLLGTSAGSITAALLAAGYTADEMLTALVETENGKPVFMDFLGEPPPFTDAEVTGGATRHLLDGVDFTFVPDFVETRLRDGLITALASNGRFRHVLALIERGGWFGADRFVSWFRSKLSSGSASGVKRDFSRMTLEQFFAATGIELSVVASDTTSGSILVLNHTTAPDCPLLYAVRMSMSIPFIWDEVVWQPGWGKYLGAAVDGHVIVDGGLLSNFPIELFISDAPQVTRLMGPKQGNPILGLLIDETVAVTISKDLVNLNIKPQELRTVRRLKQLVDTATGAHDKMIIDQYGHLVARLPAQGYGTTEFDMSDERRNALINAGRDALAQYFDTQATVSKAEAVPLVHTTAADRFAARLLSLDEREINAAPKEADVRAVQVLPTATLGGEAMIMPGEFKLPLPRDASTPATVPAEGVVSQPSDEIRRAWAHFMVNGFRQNEQMFKSTLGAFMKPYLLTVVLYGAMCLVGIGLFVAAVVIGISGNNSAVAIAFAGLSVTAFLVFFVRQPLHALEENLEFITWLGVTFNTYWTRLMYMERIDAVQSELKAAEEDFRTSVERLVTQHSQLRAKRTHGA